MKLKVGINTGNIISQMSKFIGDRMCFLSSQSGSLHFFDQILSVLNFVVWCEVPCPCQVVHVRLQTTILFPPPRNDDNIPIPFVFAMSDGIIYVDHKFLGSMVT